MSQTYYIAPLKCNHCQAISPVDTSTNMSNNATYDPGNVVFGIHDTLPIDRDDLTCDAFQINVPQNNIVKFTEIWRCPSCRETNPAEIRFAFHQQGAYIQTIHTVALTPDYLDEVHYLGMRFNLYFENLFDEQVFKSYETTTEEITRLKQLLNPL